MQQLRTFDFYKIWPELEILMAISLNSLSYSLLVSIIIRVNLTFMDLTYCPVKCGSSSISLKGNWTKKKPSSFEEGFPLFYFRSLLSINSNSMHYASFFCFQVNEVNSTFNNFHINLTCMKS